MDFACLYFIHCYFSLAKHKIENGNKTYPLCYLTTFLKNCEILFKKKYWKNLETNFLIILKKICISIFQNYLKLVIIEDVKKVLLYIFCMRSAYIFTFIHTEQVFSTSLCHNQISIWETTPIKSKNHYLKQIHDHDRK